ncbi:MAG: hypothetical protein Q9162_002998 [Coniocarpon cinnabarinum]
MFPITREEFASRPDRAVIVDDPTDEELAELCDTLKRLLSASLCTDLPLIRLKAEKVARLYAATITPFPPVSWVTGAAPTITISTTDFDKAAVAHTAPSSLAHELGHVLGHHTHELYHYNVKTMAWAILLPHMTVLYMLLKFFRFHPEAAKRRALELEADHMGAMLCARAGYRPWINRNLFEAFEKSEIKARVDEVWHPYLAERVEALDEIMPSAIATFLEAQRKGVVPRQEQNLRMMTLRVI